MNDQRRIPWIHDQSYPILDSRLSTLDSPLSRRPVCPRQIGVSSARRVMFVLLIVAGCPRIYSFPGSGGGPLGRFCVFVGRDVEFSASPRSEVSVCRTGFMVRR